MTERQIKQLKAILEQSEVAENSSELDEKILQAAHVHRPVSQVRRRWFALSAVFTQVLQPAVLAVIVTLGLFFGMSQMLSNDQTGQVVVGRGIVNQDIVSQGIVRVSPEKNTESDWEPALNRPSENAIIKPELLDALPRPELSQHAKDQILTNYDLPSSEELLASMPFELNKDRVWAQQNIVQALHDIRSMIHGGALDDARERYIRLKEECDPCTLPNTLETLVLNRWRSQGSGSSDTG